MKDAVTYAQCERRVMRGIGARWPKGRGDKGMDGRNSISSLNIGPRVATAQFVDPKERTRATNG